MSSLGQGGRLHPVSSRPPADRTKSATSSAKSSVSALPLMPALCCDFSAFRCSCEDRTLPNFSAQPLWQCLREYQGSMESTVQVSLQSYV